MKDFFGFVGWALGAFAVIVIIAASGQFLGLWSTGYFAPKYEAIRRDVMIESRAYSEATTREMYRLKIQWMQAKTEAEKSAIAAMAIHEAQGFDRDRLPAELQSFIIEIGG
jgi:hypothetical protein